MTYNSGIPRLEAEMMQVRCQRCGQMMTLGRDSIALALAEAEHKNEQYHALQCVRCRHVIKVQLAELRRRLPANYPLPNISPAGPKSTESDTVPIETKATPKP